MRSFYVSLDGKKLHTHDIHDLSEAIKLGQIHVRNNTSDEVVIDDDTKRVCVITHLNWKSYV